MTLTNEQLSALEYLDVDPVQAMEVRALVSAYRTAQTVRRQGLYALGHNDHGMLANLLNQLPPGGSGKLWAGE